MTFADHFDLAAFPGLGRDSVALAVALAAGAAGYSLSVSSVLADSAGTWGTTSVKPAFSGLPGNTAAGLAVTSAVSSFLANAAVSPEGSRPATNAANAAIANLAAASPGHVSNAVRRQAVDRTTASSYVIRYELPEPIVEAGPIVPAQQGRALAATLTIQPEFATTPASSERQLGRPGPHPPSVAPDEAAFTAIETLAPLATPGLNTADIARSVVSAPDLTPLAAQAPAAKAKTSSEPGSRLGLIGSGQDIDTFDLASLASPRSPREGQSATKRDMKAAFAEPGVKPASRSNRSAKPRLRDTVTGQYITHQTRVEFNGTEAGNLSVQVGMDGTLAIRLSDLLKIVEPGMVPMEFQRLSSSPAADELVSFAKLRAAGIGVRYDAAHDALEVSTSD